MLFQAESKEIQVTDHPMQWNPVTPVLGPQKPTTEANPQPPCEQDVVIKIRDKLCLFCKLIPHLKVSKLL